MHDLARKDLRPDLVQLELERGDDPEVASATAQRPEEVRILVVAGTNQLTGGGHYVG